MNKLYYLWSIFIFTLFLGRIGYAQTNSESEVDGVYMLQGVMETAAGFEFKADKTFEYMFTYGAADKWGKGTWKTDGTRILLSSHHSQPRSDFILIQSDARNSQGIKIKISDAENRPYAYVTCRLGKEKVTTNAQGEAYFRSIGSGNLELFHPIYSLRITQLQLNKKHNNFLIFPAADLSEVYFKDFEMEIGAEEITANQLPGMPPEDAAGKLKRYVFKQQK
ncbi:hypothetical protein [Adhaeribacter terreus]|uniref:Carboxypeptidase regulatory-like domain-containing protein n=1 Tax=Adhaeribacter terreus TaxID=529703 RepID=A0ABW0EHB3_9BACT